MKVRSRLRGGIISDGTDKANFEGRYDPKGGDRAAKI